MAITSAWCPVLGAHVTRTTDLEGAVTGIICVEYEKATGLCRVKKSTLASGPLGQLVERASEDAVSDRGTQCVLRWK